MKKILAIILAAVLVLSFAACKKNDTNNDTTAGDAQTSGQAADVSASDEYRFFRRGFLRGRDRGSHR